MGAIVTLLIFGGSALVAIAFSPIGGAIASRIRGRSPSAEIDPALLAELGEHRDRLAELEERLDFAERALLANPEARSPTHEARS